MIQIGVNLVEPLEFHASDLVECPTLPSIRVPRERRVSERRSIAVRATITLPDDAALLEGHTVDLSATGASITLPFKLSQGQRCLIDLELEAFGSSSTFHIPAQVRYCVKMESDQFRAGVRFGPIDDATAALIAALLNT
jgi:c-di-GMP-binding flagellar brake protein YcgR